MEDNWGVCGVIYTRYLVLALLKGGRPRGTQALKRKLPNIRVPTDVSLATHKQTKLDKQVLFGFYLFPFAGAPWGLVKMI